MKWARDLAGLHVAFALDGDSNLQCYGPFKTGADAVMWSDALPAHRKPPAQVWLQREMKLEAIDPAA